MRACSAQLEMLPDEIAAAVPGGCATVVPRLARRALQAACEVTPPTSVEAMPDRALSAATILRDIGRVAATELPPWPNAQESLVASLRSLPALADRAAVVETAGSWHMPPAQFVDDLTAAGPSAGAVRAVLSPEKFICVQPVR